MKHWGWMAERVADLGGEVTLTHDDIDHTRDAAYVLRGDIRRQEELAEHYAAEQATLEDEEARAILARIEAHDRFQAEQLEHLLDELQEQPCRGGAVRRRAEEPARAAAPTPPPAPRFTVGSLFGRKQDE